MDCLGVFQKFKLEVSRAHISFLLRFSADYGWPFLVENLLRLSSWLRLRYRTDLDLWIMFIFLAVLPIDHKAPFSDAWQFRGRGHLRVAFYAPSDWANSSQLSYLMKLFRPIFCEISLALCFQLPRRSLIHSWNLLSRSSNPNASALFNHLLVFILSPFSVF